MTAALWRPIEKEVRALLPTWLLCTLAVLLAGIAGDTRLTALAQVSYGLGAVALGALSMGHEYTGRTLSLLLTQPVSRWRLFAVKSGIAALMLVALAAVAWPVLDGGRTLHLGLTAVPAGGSNGALFVTPLLAGLLIAPALTMACRSPMAGVVFTVAVLGLTWGLGGVLAATWFEPAIVAPELERFRISFLLRGTLGVSAVAGVASWLLFRRLEAADGGGPIVALPRWGRDRVAHAPALERGSTRRAGPMWQLAKKELHLQQMTIFVGAVYIVWWVAMLLISRIAPAAVGESAEAIAIGYGPLLGLLAGSLASAEERQLGTLGWQVLLPVAMWKQWAVKAGVVFGLALAIGVGLPALLLSITPNISGIQGTPRLLLPVVLAATVGLYVSSLATSGVRALLLSLPVGAGILLFAASVVGPVLMASFNTVFQGTVAVLPEYSSPGRRMFLTTLLRVVMWLTPHTVAMLVAVPIVGLMLRFALTNHRSDDRPAWRTCRQATWLAGSLVVGMFLTQFIPSLSYPTLLKIRAHPAVAPHGPARPR